MKLFTGSTIALAAWFLCASSVHAQPWFDDFEDGNIFDGTPVLWAVDQDIDMSYVDYDSGDLVLHGIDPNAPEGASALVPSRVFNDVSVLAQTRIIGGGATAVLGRYNGDRGYAGSLDENGFFAISRLEENSLDFTILSSTNLGFNAADDVLLRLDIIGDSLSLTAWKPGDVMPLPQLTATDADFASGAAGVGLLEQNSMPDSSAVFRFAQAVPEASTIVTSFVICISALLAVQCRPGKRSR